MDVLVVGAGAMGRWFATAVDERVTFADVDPSAARAAAEAVGGRVDEADGDGRFDVVCIAVPMSATESAVAEHADRAREALVDVTGEMTTPLVAMAERAPGVERASFHPLFAPENAPGNVAVVEDAPGPTTAAIREALTGAGNELIETTASEHDRAMETIQAAAHAAILAYGVAAEDVPEGFETPVSSALDDLVEQVAGGEPHVYAEIQATFEGADRVADAAGAIAAAEGDRFRELYEAARPARPTRDWDGRTTEDDDGRS